MKEIDGNPSSSCCGGGSCGIERRDFITTLVAGAASAVVAMPVMAGPFEAAEQDRLVPADKKLDAKWVRSLAARGRREVYRGKELEKIGMPIGGLCAGQLYLGGDGKLWRWDIFNKTAGTGDGNYAHPPLPTSPLEQGFAIELEVDGRKEVRALDRRGFQDISFCGEYPFGYVEYRDPKLPIAVSLEAFSPFVPLDTLASSLPATVMRFTVKNTGSARATVQLAGWLENAVGLYTMPGDASPRRNAVERKPGVLLIHSDMLPQPAEKPSRVDILFEDFKKPTYADWTVTGDAFGKGPILKSQIPAYQGDVGTKGPRVVNSHASAPGRSVEEKDSHTGTLTSRQFTIERSFIGFWIGGGSHAGKTCINLIIDGKVARSATGRNDNRMRREVFDVRALEGKSARIEIVDKETGPWGNIGAGPITFTDRRPNLSEDHDQGTLALALLEPGESDLATPGVAEGKLPLAAFTSDAQPHARQPAGRKLIGAIVRKMTLEPGQEATATFVIAWHFPHLHLKDGGRFYATRFHDAAAAAEHLATNFAHLHAETRLWHDTWYDSTLPHWFLDRTMLNTSILATSTAHLFANGRFYGWEGVGCCEGTCTHVWHYAHAVARLFPDLERDLRRRTDFGTAQDPRTGMIKHRGEGAGLAVDGQAGCILRAYREHQMSTDGRMLKELWPRIKLAMEFLIHMDDGQGLIEGAQHNTLDQPWFGKIAWLSSLYLAALRACNEMANDVGDREFANKVGEIAKRSQTSIENQLFNGEYYVHIPDKAHEHTVGSHNGCEIDQVFGASWAYQVGLGRILSTNQVHKALKSLWKYNFAPDVGPFRKAHPPGRWYAMAGEAGLIMCTWPRGEGRRVQQGFDFYFNECMNGFEYQVAGHMIWEGMVQEGLAITRAIHDRYHPARRNPWNEVECGDHYARSMASYGVYLAACGYEYHGPKRYLGFAPRLTPENFRAAFTTAEGWGTFSQKDEHGKRTACVELKHGKLALKSLGLLAGTTGAPPTVSITLAGKPIEGRVTLEANGRALISLPAEITIHAPEQLTLQWSVAAH